jgi:GAF domain-containing protein
MSPAPDSTLSDPQQAIVDLERRLVERTAERDHYKTERDAYKAERDEAVAQQTAAAEVLQVINSSPRQLAPVFDAILERAMALCEADYGHVYTFEDGEFSPAAIRGDPEFVSYRQQRGPIRPQGDGTSALERLIAGESVLWAADVHEQQAYHTNARFRELADNAGIRSMATIALRKESALKGTIIVYRRQVRPFSDRQIALLQNFAAQAVIAMENARLLTEAREALEQQTATAEVLGVINSSPGDLKPVFDAMLEKALSLCGASFGSFGTYDGECFHVVASRGHMEFEEWARQRGPARPEPGTTVGRIAQGERVVQILDIADDEAYRKGASSFRRALVEIGGFRTLLTIALRKDETLRGYLHVYRQEVRPFTDKQIALLQNFAAQAVIAMENARLITETREALEQQTATAEVLGVINSSPGDLAPVFDAMLEKATRLCDASYGLFWTYDGQSIGS